VAANGYTVAEAVKTWLVFGLNGRGEETVKNYRFLAEGHIVPDLVRRKLRELSAEDVEKWLADMATKVSTRTVRLLHSILNRAVKHAQARESTLKRETR
jgi:wobble nucleotide-excising tRNase